MVVRHNTSRLIVMVIIAIACIQYHPIDGFVVIRPTATGITTTPTSAAATTTALCASTESTGNGVASNPDADPDPNGPPTPVLNGKRVLPVKIMMAGLKGHKVAATYAVLSRDFKKPRDGGGGGDWESCKHVGVSLDLGATLAEHLEEQTNRNCKENVGHIRALSFMIPNESAMESIASDWRKLALAEKGVTNFDPVVAAMDLEDYLDDEDDDFDDDDDDDYFEMMAGAIATSRQEVAEARGIIEPEETKEEETVVSPFDNPQTYTTTDGEALTFSKEAVDKVLDEIRPYLISDGGNVSVDSVDLETKSVYLVLEGACGSCPSSTVTMQMGIERVLKENFSDLGEVKQVDPDNNDDSPKELTYLTVEKEVNRIKPAIMAMGGLVDILEVDAIGTVKLRFRGANKVKQGLEMALLDIEFVKHIEFVMQ